MYDRDVRYVLNLNNDKYLFYTVSEARDFVRQFIRSNGGFSVHTLYDPLNKCYIDIWSMQCGMQYSVIENDINWAKEGF